MRIRETARVCAGAAVVYVAMAACGASDGSPTGLADRDATAGDGANQDLDGSERLDAIVDAIGDALVNPVKDAKADPPLPPDVYVEQCDKTGIFNGIDALMAVHDFPGKTINDLSAVRVVGHSSSFMVTIGPKTYSSYRTEQVASIDGSMVVYCGVTGHLVYDTVTFISPK